tara:strand:- start:183 stop:488 length:306 start_codon:yes stop_codon:yes gene_type:complete
MKLYGEPRVWLEQFPLGEPASFNHEHLGVRHPGEVVRCEGRSFERGEPPVRLSFIVQQARSDLRSVHSTVRNSYPDHRQLEAGLSAPSSTLTPELLARECA